MTIECGEYWWPEPFLTGFLDAPFPSTVESRAKVCADALVAWGNCHAGQKPPAKFGEGMSAVGRYLNIVPTDDKLSEYADAIVKEIGEQQATD